MERDRWNDDRLSDRFKGIERALSDHDKRLAGHDERLNVHRKELDLLADTNLRMIKLDGRVAMIAEDTVECRTGIKEMRQIQEDTADALRAWQLAQAEAKLEEREKLEEERKSDRRWLIGTMLTVAALLIAAMGVLGAAGVIGATGVL